MIPTSNIAIGIEFEKDGAKWVITSFDEYNPERLSGELVYMVACVRLKSNGTKGKRNATYFTDRITTWRTYNK